MSTERAGASTRDDFGWAFSGVAALLGRALLAAVALIPVALPAAAYTVLHHHRPNDGGQSTSGVVMDSSGYLYGTTQNQGASDLGTLFRVKSDGSDYKVLHDFAGSPSDGGTPASGLVLDSSGTLYGTAFQGGASNNGAIYKLSTDGTGFVLLHSFTAGVDGAGPVGRLCLDGSGHLYGTTQTSVFSIATNGTSFTLLHTFVGGISDGSFCVGGLVLDGSGTLFGTTRGGGVWDDGIVFSLQTNGSGYTLLHVFTGATDGKHSESGLLLDPLGNLYGNTNEGGASGLGVVFTLTTSGTGFTVLHNFAGGASDGAKPDFMDLARDGSGNLYGTTYAGGASDKGTIFSIKTTGAGFSVLHSFDGASGGANPQSGLLVDGAGKLYGTASYGGDSSSSGIAYSLMNDGSAFTVLHTFRGTASDGSQPQAGLVSDGSGNLYGTTLLGGAYNLGTLFTLKSDGTGFRLLYSFAGGSTDGASPNAGLVLMGSRLYGTTLIGGTSNYGTVFGIDTDGNNQTLLHSFAGGAADGKYPRAGLLGNVPGFPTGLFGTTSQGGASGLGTVFTVSTNGAFGLLHSFAGGAADGAAPYGGLIVDGYSYFYGTTYQGGASNLGTVFKVSWSASGFTLLHSFAGGATDGFSPYGGLYFDSLGYLYGTTNGGGSSGFGTVYKVKADATGFLLLHSFAGGTSDGSSPYAGLVGDASGNLYGTTRNGAAGGWGAVFKLTTTGTGYALLHSFAGAPSDGGFSKASLALDGSGNLFGTTERGGALDLGTEFVIPTSCASGDAGAPVVTAPTPITIDQTACCGGASGATSTTLSAFIAGGTAGDDCAIPTRLAPQVSGSDVTNSTCFDAGTTSITFRWQDAAAHVGSATSTVTVHMFGDLNLDTFVDPSDMVVMRAFFNFAATPEVAPFNAPLEIADVTHDTIVDPSDMVVLRSYFNFAVACLAP